MRWFGANGRLLKCNLAGMDLFNLGTLLTISSYGAVACSTSGEGVSSGAMTYFTLFRDLHAFLLSFSFVIEY